MGSDMTDSDVVIELSDPEISELIEFAKNLDNSKLDERLRPFNVPIDWEKLWHKQVGH